ncbi:MAG TPA: chemotaxis protein CheD [bacterium]|nr:chemotaxis protein CheD [bacterium]
MAENEIQLANYTLQPGYIYFAKEPTLITTVLGSCVSVALYDTKQKIGGMNHYRLPLPPNKNERTAVYGFPAIYKLIHLLLDNGAEKENLTAQIFGGAINEIYSNNEKIGEKNVEIAEKMLKKYSIKIVSKDTGGNLGRKVVFNTFTGECIILKVEKLRRTDWL